MQTLGELVEILKTATTVGEIPLTSQKSATQQVIRGNHTLNYKDNIRITTLTEHNQLQNNQESEEQN